METNNIYQLNERYAQSIDWLNQILKGGKADTIDVGGVIKPSITKDIEDRWSGLSAMVQGRLPYETKSQMTAAGAPPPGTVLAEVWRDSVATNNGLYGWTGSVWEKSPYDTISTLTQLQQAVDKQGTGLMGATLVGNSNNLYGPADHSNYQNYINLTTITRESVDGVHCLHFSADHHYSNYLDLADFTSGFISVGLFVYQQGPVKNSNAKNRLVIFQLSEYGIELERHEVWADNGLEQQWLIAEGVHIVPDCTKLRWYVECYYATVYVSHIGIYNGKDGSYRVPDMPGNLWPDRDYEGFGIEPDLPNFPSRLLDENGRLNYTLPVTPSERVYMWNYSAKPPFSPGRSVNFKGWFNNPSMVRAVQAEVQFLDADGVLIESSNTDANNTLDWETFNVRATIPAATHSIRIGWRQYGAASAPTQIHSVELWSNESGKLPVLSSTQVINQIRRQVGADIQARPTWHALRADDNRVFGNLIRDPVNYADFSATLNKGEIDDVYCGLLGTNYTQIATLRIPPSHFRNETGSFGIKLAENSAETKGRILIRMMVGPATESLEHRVEYYFQLSDRVECGAARDEWKTLVIPNFRVPNDTLDLYAVEIYIDAGTSTNPERVLAFCDPWITSGKVYNPIPVLSSFNDYWVDPTMMGNQSDGRGNNLPASGPNMLSAFEVEADNTFYGRRYRFSVGGAWQAGARLHFHAEMFLSPDSAAANRGEIAFIYYDMAGGEISRQSVRTSKLGVWQSKDIVLLIPEDTTDFEIRCGARGDELTGGYVKAMFRNFVVSEAPQTSPWRKIIHGGGAVGQAAGTKVVYVSPFGSDAGSGTQMSPYQTGARAAQDLPGGGVIRLMAGTYPDFAIPVSHITGTLVVTGDSMTRPRILNESGKITSAWAKQGGTDHVWFAQVQTYSGHFIWEHETPQHPIDEAERHPLQRGRTHRLPSYRLRKVNSIASCDANRGSWFYDEVEERLYLHNSDSTDPNQRVYYLPTSKSLLTGNHTGLHAVIKQTDVWYGRYGLENLGSFELHDVRNMGGGSNGCDRGRTCGVENRVEYCGNNNDGGNAHNVNSEWDGLPGTLPPASTVTSVDMYCHDNYDDGDSLHERCEGTYIGGLWEYNGDRGVATSYGAHVTLINGVARHNGQYADSLGQSYPGSASGGEGFACVGPAAEAEGGMGTQMVCNSCVSYGNNLNFALNSGGAKDRMDCINCISEDGKVAGYSAQYDDRIMTLRNCTDRGSVMPKREVNGGRIIVKNGDLVT